MISILCPICNVRVAAWWDPLGQEFVHHFEKDGKIYRHRWRVNNSSASASVSVPPTPATGGAGVIIRQAAKPGIPVDQIPVDEDDPKAAWRIFPSKWRKWLSR